MEPDTNGWSEWKIHVLAEIDRLNKTLADHTESDTENFKELRDLINSGVTKISLDVNTLKTKAGVWGTVGGGLISALIAFATTMLGK
jgi:hypothetical protein